MKKLFLYAYDRRNLGDDLFVEHITRRYPDTQFYIWSGVENKATYGSIPNLKRVGPDSRVVRLLRKLPFLGFLMPAVWNAFLVGWELSVYIGGGFWINTLYVAIGEAAVLLTLGTVLYYALKARNLHSRLFS